MKKLRTLPKTQRDRFVEQGGAVLSKSAVIATVRCFAKAATRTTSPLLLVADGMQVGAECLLTHYGCEGRAITLAGRGVGMSASAVIGLALGVAAGPLGAAIAAGTAVTLWAGGEIAGCSLSHLVNKWTAHADDG